MKFYYDTEFLEGTQECYSWMGLKTDTWFRILALLIYGFGIVLLYSNRVDLVIGLIGSTCWLIGTFLVSISIPKTPPTIDLISIGIVGEDGREYYAISKDFNLREAWNRHDIKPAKDISIPDQKIYWIRENVLKPIFFELQQMAYNDPNQFPVPEEFSFKALKTLIKRYGKSRETIADEVQEFVYRFGTIGYPKDLTEQIAPKDVEFYGYYADYDHVALSWLYGKMIDLPKGFPMFTWNLKQLSDQLYETKKAHYLAKGNLTFIESIKDHPDYPLNNNEHSAISDARWNKKLYDFIMEWK